MVEKLNLFLDLLQSYKVSFALFLPVRKLFRASLCSSEDVMPTKWKSVWEGGLEAQRACGRGMGVAVSLS